MRKITIFIVLIMFCFSLCGCNDISENTAPTVDTTITLETTSPTSETVAYNIEDNLGELPETADVNFIQYVCNCFPGTRCLGVEQIDDMKLLYKFTNGKFEFECVEWLYNDKMPLVHTTPNSYETNFAYRMSDYMKDEIMALAKKYDIVLRFKEDEPEKNICISAAYFDFVYTDFAKLYSFCDFLDELYLLVKENYNEYSSVFVGFDSLHFNVKGPESFKLGTISMAPYKSSFDSSYWVDYFEQLYVSYVADKFFR